MNCWRVPVIASVLLASLLLQKSQANGDGKCAALDDVNGCSTPFKRFPYRDRFTPSCNSHDVCYRCVSQYTFFKVDLQFLKEVKRV